MRKTITSSATATVDPASDAGDEKRRQPRFDVRSEALVSVLGSGPAVRAEILDLSQKGLKLSAKSGFPIGEIIRAEIDDEVFVAAVCYCKESKGVFTIGTEMMHSIKRLHLDQLVTEWGVR